MKTTQLAPAIALGFIALLASASQLKADTINSNATLPGAVYSDGSYVNGSFGVPVLSGTAAAAITLTVGGVTYTALGDSWFATSIPGIGQLTFEATSSLGLAAIVMFADESTIGAAGSDPPFCSDDNPCAGGLVSFYQVANGTPIYMISGSFTPQAAPEPSSLALLGTGLALVGLVGAIRQKEIV
jgi:hypothetical protein